MNSDNPTSILAKQLQKRVQGSVLSPESPQYDQARMAWNLTVDQRPALIVFIESKDDVVEAVRFAAEAGLDIAVQATGHGVTRPANDCLLINTSRLNDVQVDAEAQTAWVEAGAKWKVVLEAAQEHGLAPLLGSSPDVGAVGYTLGGGMGWLARKFGLSADSVNAFEVVTADGRILPVNEDENSELFWALQGGGGSFGVITAMEIRLYPVTMVYAGNLIYPVEQAKAVLTRFRDWVESAPDELTSSVALMNLPPLPIVPEFLRGKSVIMFRGCYCGPVEEGEALVNTWREWQAPFMDMFQPIPFSAAASISNDPEDPVPGHTTGAWLRELSDEAIGILVRRATPVEGPSPLLFAEVRHAGGAVSRVDARANAFGNRDAVFSLQLTGMTPTPEANSHFVAFTDAVKEELKPAMHDGVYMNFLEGEEARLRVEDGFSVEDYRRLRHVKAKYDPDNRFAYSFNIPPAK